jgi:hypothetical protein
VLGHQEETLGLEGVSERTLLTGANGQRQHTTTPVRGVTHLDVPDVDPRTLEGMPDLRQLPRAIGEGDTHLRHG